MPLCLRRYGQSRLLGQLDAPLVGHLEEQQVGDLLDVVAVVHTIYVFSNDGKALLKTLGEKNVPGSDSTHFAKPQDVAFLPDGRILIADGLDNHRVMILDSAMNYLGEFGGNGKGPGQFNGVHAMAVGPNGLIFALDRSGGRINVFRTTADPKKVDYVDAFPGFSLPLDIIVNDDSIWITDLKPLRFVKLDFKGNRLYTWLVPPDLPDGYLEVHTFSVDSEGEFVRRGQSVRKDSEIRAEARRGSEAADQRAVAGQWANRREANEQESRLFACWPTGLLAYLTLTTTSL